MVCFCVHPDRGRQRPGPRGQPRQNLRLQLSQHASPGIPVLDDIRALLEFRSRCSSLFYKKKIRSERARESENVKKLIHCAWLLGSSGCILSEWKNVWISFGIPRGDRPKWSLRWRVDASENEWLHVAKTAKHLHRTVERHADITSALLERSSSAKGGQKTTKMSDWDHQGHPKNSDSERSWEKKTTNTNTTKKCRNKEDQLWTEVTTNHYNPAVLRPERAPPTRRAPPWIGHAIRHVCVNGPIEYEWLDSVQRSQVHLLRRHAPASHRKKAPSSARGGREPGVRLEKTKKCVSHVRQSGWMSCVCLGACVTVSVWGWVRTRAEKEGKTNDKRSLTS